MEANIFLQLSALLAITASVAFFVRAAKQPLLVAYIVAGIIAGPRLLNILSGSDALYHAFASFGVVLLLFVIGLDLNFSYLKKIGREASLIGLAQFLLNFGLTLPIAHSFGLSWTGSAFLAMAACFSSTIVVLKILGEKRDEDSVYGRYTIGLMLVQDMISIFILLALSFGTVDNLAFSWLPLIKGLLVAVLLTVVIRYFLFELLDKVASSGEFLFIFTVAWCFGVAALLNWVGLSLEVGAIIAGLSLGSSRYHREIASRIKPLRDFFLLIFFLLLGSQADFSRFHEVVLPALILAAFILIAKPIILYNLFRLRRFTRRNSFLSALSSGQLSEFGFIILFAGAAGGYISGRELSIFTVAAIVTIFFSSYLMTYSRQAYTFIAPILLHFGEDRHVQKEPSKEKFEAMIFGYHRTGWKIGQALSRQKIKFAAADFDPELVKHYRHSGMRMFFGDVSDVEFLLSLPLEKVRTVVSTVPSPEDQLLLISFLRKINPKVVIIASLYHKKYLDALYKAGADYVLLPHLFGGAWAAEVIDNGELHQRRSWSKYRRQQALDLNGS